MMGERKCLYCGEWIEADDLAHLCLQPDPDDDLILEDDE